MEPRDMLNSNLLKLFKYLKPFPSLLQASRDIGHSSCKYKKMTREEHKKRQSVDNLMLSAVFLCAYEKVKQIPTCRGNTSNLFFIGTVTSEIS